MLRVLVAEDHPVSRQVMGLVLEQLGATPTLVADGREAVYAWRTQRFDLILMDIHMPGLSGLRATEIIRAEERSSAQATPIIIVSSDFRPEQIGQCLQAGADLHIAKPITARVLASAMESVIEGRSARRDATPPRSSYGA